MARVSVIVPAWGETPYLSEALESLSAQTFRDVEIVQCEPLSTGPQTAIATRMAGVARATGEWVMFLDADDTLEPEAVERLSALATDATDVVVSGLIRKGIKRLWKPSIWATGPGDVFNCLVAKLFRRRLFDGLVRDDALLLGEDLLLTAQLLHRARRIAVVDDAFYNYRDNPASVTHSLEGRQRVQDLARVGAHLRKAMPEPRYDDFHDRVTRDAMLLWIRHRVGDRALWRELRGRLKSGLLSDHRHGLIKKGALLCASCLFD